MWSGSVAPRVRVEVHVMTKRLLILVVLAILIAAIVKKARSHRESEWHGLSESDARAKLDAKLPSRIPADKRSVISDKVITKMRDRGVISEAGEVTGEPSGVADTTADTTAEAAAATARGQLDDTAVEAIDLRDGASKASEHAQN